MYSCILLAAAVHPKCAADTTRKSDNSGYSFALNDYSASEPTEFEFFYTLDGIKYWYAFSATKEKNRFGISVSCA